MTGVTRSGEDACPASGAWSDVATFDCGPDSWPAQATRPRANKAAMRTRDRDGNGLMCMLDSMRKVDAATSPVTGAAEQAQAGSALAAMA